MSCRTLSILLLASTTLAACRGGGDRPAPSSDFRPERRAVATLGPEQSPTPLVILVTLTPDPTAAAIATQGALLAATQSAATAAAESRTATVQSLPSPADTRTATAAAGQLTTATPAARGTSATATARRSGGGPAQPTSVGGGTATLARPPAQGTPPSVTPPPAAPQGGPTEDTSALAALRGGGFVIYVRHTRTDWSQDPREREWVGELLERRDDSLFEQCERQRLLSDEGRNQARAIGDAFRRLGIPVGRVLTSPWCRVRDTAQLAFGRGEAVVDRLWDSGYLPADERARYRDRLRALLSSPPEGGSNTVLVGHMPQLYDVTGVALEEGESLLVWPQGDGFRALNRVPADGWDQLARVPLR